MNSIKQHRLVLFVAAGLMILPTACRSQRAVSTRPDALATDRAALDTLLERMAQRLELMHDVSRVKWNTQRPVRDSERERALVEDMVKRGTSLQLDAEFTGAFFTAQIEAAVQVQEADFQKWRAENQPAFVDAPTLDMLRERIDAINGELLTALPRARSYLQTEEGQEYLARRAGKALGAFPEVIRDTALRPLRN
ncbi:MAG: gamma subclass chorismate mutase AroQ [Gemmataceae bacterium]|nr:gamma subclass chorismate mutase AroQ [Gemmataceae bacterium]